MLQLRAALQSSELGRTRLRAALEAVHAHLPAASLHGSSEPSSSRSGHKVPIPSSTVGEVNVLPCVPSQYGSIENRAMLCFRTTVTFVIMP